MATRNYGQHCGVTTALELIGERWALLIVRDLLVGARRYTDLKQGLPRIPTNILAARLRELQESHVVRRVAIVHRGPVYELTEYGRRLEPIVLALGRWGFARLGEPQEGDVLTPASLTMTLRAAFQADAAGALPAAAYEVRAGEIALRVRVGREGLDIRQLAPVVTPVGGRLDEGESDVVFATGPGLRRVISGEVTPAEAIDLGIIDLVRGEASLLERFAATFRIDPE